ncbi:TIGR02530 family flagellar biosynthesis protein [Bacillus sp. EB600]|uniref:TIGR02530 family flagellar biosynthesis protein n=1 Tax=Bacillus sp. EB600 TaxID=2806345 RepID=UPI00210BBD3F|nr:TIGR02530 family flagellar biosynthesis protein [Bacillus sp. EB600]MCQ6280195.1 flagellar protein [Bacillus sp. EB600]
MDHTQFRLIGTAFVPDNPYKEPKAKQANNGSFSAQLQSAIQSKPKLMVSKHAQERLKQRNIHITSENWTKIEEKVSEAKRLGITDSLVLLPEAALIVSAKNQTVITALGREEAASQIFTNINGTIVLE